MDAPEIVQRQRRRYQRFFRRAFMLGAGIALILFGVPVLAPNSVAMPSSLVESQLPLVSILVAVVVWSLAGWITMTLVIWVGSIRNSPDPRFRTR